MTDNPDAFLRRHGIVIDLPRAGGPIDRSNFLPGAWCDLKLPERDWLFRDVLCTTSRWLIIGETGVGKTLLLLALAFAVALGRKFLNWDGGRPCRVMYLDGELPAETMQERILDAVRLYGREANVFVYNRDRLLAEDMPPLNSEEGRAWLFAEVDAIKPDLVILDSIMVLLTGKMDDEQWAAVKPVVDTLTMMRVAQIWLHHTGHDTSHGFGTKTREWMMDLVAMLSKASAGGEDEPGAEPIRLTFKKTRLKRPETAHLYLALDLVRTDDGWTCKVADRAAGASPPLSKNKRLQRQILECLDELADGVTLVPGLDGRSRVRKVRWAEVRVEMKRRGYFGVEGDGPKDDALSQADRTALSTARSELLAKATIVFREGFLWRP